MLSSPPADVGRRPARALAAAQVVLLALAGLVVHASPAHRAPQPGGAVPFAATVGAAAAQAPLLGPDSTVTQPPGLPGLPGLPGPPPAAPAPAATTPTPGSGPAPVTTPAGTPPGVLARPGVTGPLHVSGNRLLDAAGAPLVLRGLNRVGYEQRTSHLLTAAEVSAARGWGADALRLPLSAADWLAPCAGDDPDYPRKVDDAVAAITGAGLVAVLDLHAVRWGGCAAAGPQDLPLLSDGQAFWSQVAARYRGNSRVVFELYNEPHGVTRQVWLHGGSVTASGLIGGVAGRSVEVAGMQQMFDAVRGAGAGNLVLLDAPDYATDAGAFAGGTGLDGHGQVIDAAPALHLYTCATPADTGCLANPSSHARPAAQLDAWSPVAATLPVVVTEVGYPSRDHQADAAAYLADTISWLNHQPAGWSWLAFAWDGTATGDYTLVSDPGLATPNEAGAAVRSRLSGR